MPVAKEFGDFQTPPELACAVVWHLSRHFTDKPRILEPTCGIGNFIAAVQESELPAAEMIGIELNPEHAGRASARLAGATIINASIFEVDLDQGLPWQTNQPLLVLGNPPWVTSATITTSGGTNLPPQSNFKNKRGLEAVTGSANFDICEYIWIQLLEQFHTQPAVLSLLCKTSTTRSVIQYAYDKKLCISQSTAHRIDAKHWFGAAVDACLFTVRCGGGKSDYSISWHTGLDSEQAGEPNALVDGGSVRPPVRTGFVNNRYVHDLDRYKDIAFLDGGCDGDRRWRQGIKHDAASVLELELAETDRRWQNKQGQPVDVEPDCLFPLLKTQDLLGTTLPPLERALIVTQRHTSDSTQQLEQSLPRLWQYLKLHDQAFKARKSRIYNNKEPYSMFGVGPYSFSPHKVVVSGFAKEPRFWSISLRDGKPFVLDDTCYLLPCRSADESQELATVLNSQRARSFLESITDFRAKRPITAAVLNRINLDRLLTSF